MKLSAILSVISMALATSAMPHGNCPCGAVQPSSTTPSVAKPSVTKPAEAKPAKPKPAEPNNPTSCSVENPKQLCCNTVKKPGLVGLLDTVSCAVQVLGSNCNNEAYCCSTTQDVVCICLCPSRPMDRFHPSLRHALFLLRYCEPVANLYG
jgi:hypothetical protein